MKIGHCLLLSLCFFTSAHSGSQIDLNQYFPLPVSGPQQVDGFLVKTTTIEIPDSREGRIQRLLVPTKDKLSFAWTDDEVALVIPFFVPDTDEDLGIYVDVTLKGRTVKLPAGPPSSLYGILRLDGSDIKQGEVFGYGASSAIQHGKEFYTRFEWFEGMLNSSKICMNPGSQSGYFDDDYFYMGIEADETYRSFYRNDSQNGRSERVASFYFPADSPRGWYALWIAVEIHRFTNDQRIKAIFREQRIDTLDLDVHAKVVGLRNPQDASGTATLVLGEDIESAQRSIDAYADDPEQQDRMLNKLLRWVRLSDVRIPLEIRLNGYQFVETKISQTHITHRKEGWPDPSLAAELVNAQVSGTSTAVRARSEGQKFDGRGNLEIKSVLNWDLQFPDKIYDFRDFEVRYGGNRTITGPKSTYAFGGWSVSPGSLLGSIEWDPRPPDAKQIGQRSGVIRYTYRNSGPAWREFKDPLGGDTLHYTDREAGDRSPVGIFAYQLPLPGSAEDPSVVLCYQRCSHLESNLGGTIGPPGQLVRIASESRQVEDDGYWQWKKGFVEQAEAAFGRAASTARVFADQQEILRDLDQLEMRLVRDTLPKIVKNKSLLEEGAVQAGDALKWGYYKKLHKIRNERDALVKAQIEAIESHKKELASLLPSFDEQLKKTKASRRKRDDMETTRRGLEFKIKQCEFDMIRAAGWPQSGREQYEKELMALETRAASKLGPFANLMMASLEFKKAEEVEKQLLLQANESEVMGRAHVPDPQLVDLARHYRRNPLIRVKETLKDDPRNALAQELHIEYETWWLNRIASALDFESTVTFNQFKAYMKNRGMDNIEESWDSVYEWGRDMFGYLPNANPVVLLFGLEGAAKFEQRYAGQVQWDNARAQVSIMLMKKFIRAGIPLAEAKSVRKDQIGEVIGLKAVNGQTLDPVKAFVMWEDLVWTYQNHQAIRILAEAKDEFDMIDLEEAIEDGYYEHINPDLCWGEFWGSFLSPRELFFLWLGTPGGGQKVIIGGAKYLGTTRLGSQFVNGKLVAVLKNVVENERLFYESLHWAEKGIYEIHKISALLMVYGSAAILCDEFNLYYTRQFVDFLGIVGFHEIAGQLLAKSGVATSKVMRALTTYEDHLHRKHRIIAALDDEIATVGRKIRSGSDEIVVDDMKTLKELEDLINSYRRQQAEMIVRQADEPAPSLFRELVDEQGSRKVDIDPEAHPDPSYLNKEIAFVDACEQYVVAARQENIVEIKAIEEFLNDVSDDVSRSIEVDLDNVKRSKALVESVDNPKPKKPLDSTEPKPLMDERIPQESVTLSYDEVMAAAARNENAPSIKFVQHEAYQKDFSGLLRRADMKLKSGEIDEAARLYREFGDSINRNPDESTRKMLSNLLEDRKKRVTNARIVSKWREQLRKQASAYSAWDDIGPDEARLLSQIEIDNGAGSANGLRVEPMSSEVRGANPSYLITDEATGKPLYIFKHFPEVPNGGGPLTDEEQMLRIFNEVGGAAFVNELADRLEAKGIKHVTRAPASGMVEMTVNGKKVKGVVARCVENAKTCDKLDEGALMAMGQEIGMSRLIRGILGDLDGKPNNMLVSMENGAHVTFDFDMAHLAGSKVQGAGKIHAPAGKGNGLPLYQNQHSTFYPDQKELMDGVMNWPLDPAVQVGYRQYGAINQLDQVFDIDAIDPAFEVIHEMCSDETLLRNLFSGKNVSSEGYGFSDDWIEEAVEVMQERGVRGNNGLSPVEEVMRDKYDRPLSTIPDSLDFYNRPNPPYESVWKDPFLDKGGRFAPGWRDGLLTFELAMLAA